jgi:tRNA/rRNA methyltransferase
MKNDDVYRCHTCLSIPTNPQFGSLNLASAVQLLAYEWRLATGGFSSAETNTQAAKAALATIENQAQTLADAASVAGALAHWQEALVALGYLDPASPKKLMPRLQQLANRAQLKPEDINILRGIAKKILQTR